MKKHSAKDFFAGILLMTLIFGLTSPAGAALAGKTIQVLTGVEIYVDGVEMKPTDANGKPVETFVYNGTTYHTSKVITNKPKKNAPDCPAKSVRRRSPKFDMRMRFSPLPYPTCSASPGLKSPAMLL